MGKLLLDRLINKNVIKAIIFKAWRTSKSVQIVDLKENIFLFKFACEGDKKRIVELGPWNIEGFPLILKMWHQNFSVEDMIFRVFLYGSRFIISPLSTCSRRRQRRLELWLEK